MNIVKIIKIKLKNFLTKNQKSILADTLQMNKNISPLSDTPILIIFFLFLVIFSICLVI